MEGKPLKAIIWDLDGTIIHFNIDYLKARRTANRILQQHGIPKKVLSVKNAIFENVKTAREIFRQVNMTDSEINSIVSEVDDAVAKIEHDAALNATPIDGISQVLDFAHENGLKQSIYTFNRTDNALRSLETVNFSHYFDLIVGRDSVQNPKPHPDHITYIFNNLNVKADESVVIGDNRRDIMGANIVNARSIGLITKFSKYQSFEDADMVVNEKDLPFKLIEAIRKFL